MVGATFADAGGLDCWGVILLGSIVGRVLGMDSIDESGSNGEEFVG
jgi:hypothetical protein